MKLVIRWTVFLSLALSISHAHAEPPRVTDDRLVIELVAKEPDIVTPTGLAVDAQGRVWVIENQTHQRTEKYEGPPTDRIRVFAGFDAAGKACEITTFADGLKDAMGIAFDADQTLFVATRSEIFSMPITGPASGQRRSIVKLDSEATYPHNGLSGFAFDGLGNLHFGMGENLGKSYKLIGSDGTTIAGGGEGGNLFRCRQDGGQLIRIATGFWNPFHHCFDGLGRLFAVDNDPDSRGPCRLLHVVLGGDYGYRFRYGRKGTHPFQSWNGELPGTLGMVAGTGEAPSGVLAYESTGLPAEYRGELLVTSWGDHLVERFHLVPQGASFRAQSQTLIHGDEDFRPVAIAAGPDGTVYLSDWANKSYPVHGFGRLWRIRMKEPPPDDGIRAGDVAGFDTPKLAELLGHGRIEVRKAATDALVKKGPEIAPILRKVLAENSDPRAKMHALWTTAGLDRVGHQLLSSADFNSVAEVRAEAVRLLPDTMAWNLDKLALQDPSAAVRMQALLRIGASSTQNPNVMSALVPLLGDRDPFLASAAIYAFGRPKNARLLMVPTEDSRIRLGRLLALRTSGAAEGRAAVAIFLNDFDPQVRRAAIQWVGEAGWQEYAPQLERAAAKSPTDVSLFLAMLASRHLLSGGKPDAEPFNEALLAGIVQNTEQPAAFRVAAMQLLPAKNPALSTASLRKFLQGDDADLRRAALWTLSQRRDQDSQDLLMELARSPHLLSSERADAALALSEGASGSADVRTILLSLLDQPDLRRDALRSLRGAARQADVAASLLAWWDRTELRRSDRSELAAQLSLALEGNNPPEIEKRRESLATIAGPRPGTTAEWQQFLADGGDPEAGQRVFFHPLGPRCSMCHQMEGRGGNIGPELSRIGSALSRERLVQSLLEPSREIAPMFSSWVVTTQDGKAYTGVIVDDNAHSSVTLADAKGQRVVLARQNIESRVPLTTSLMPDNLSRQMTPREFLDLIAYLAQQK